MQLVELQLTKMRALGLDWSVPASSSALSLPLQKNADPAHEHRTTGRFSVPVDAAEQMSGLVNALCAQGLGKMLAAPTIVTMSGRSASFKISERSPPAADLKPGGQAPAYTSWTGTRCDIIPVLADEGRIAVNVRFKWAYRRRPPSAGIPDDQRIEHYEIDTSVEAESGQTVVVSGLRRIDGIAGESVVCLMITPERIAASPPAVAERTGTQTSR